MYLMTGHIYHTRETLSSDEKSCFLGRAQPSQTLPLGEGMRKPGFPIPPLEGCASQTPAGGGVGKPGFPTRLSEGLCSW